MERISSTEYSVVFLVIAFEEFIFVVRSAVNSVSTVLELRVFSQINR